MTVYIARHGLTRVYSTSKSTSPLYIAHEKSLSRSPMTFVFIRDHLSEIIAESNVSDALKITQTAFENEAITMYECHLLAHLIGHTFFTHEPLEKDNLKKYDLYFCEGGFRHGIESEIALRGGDGFREELYRFCGILKDLGVGAGCYHGAGHTFMRETLDPEEGMKLCDSLASGPYKDVHDCYKGVYSEYNNLLGGVDGETGYPFTGERLFVLSEHPLDFCASLPEKHQLPCAHEVSAQGFGEHSTSEQVDIALHECHQRKHYGEIALACIRSIAAIYTQHELPRSETIYPREIIFPWSQEYRHAFILGAAQEMKEFLDSGSRKDWNAFCQSFPKTVDQVYCAEFFS